MTESKVIDTIKYISTHLASIILMIFGVIFAGIALTALIVFVEEVVVFIWKGRLINSYTNTYGNAVYVLFWHWLLIFLFISYWAALDVFLPKNKDRVALNIDFNTPQK